VEKPKFKRGNLVRIDDDLGESMAHFEKGCDAIINSVHKAHGDYIDENNNRYTEYRYDYEVMFPDTGNIAAWYYENQLTLIDEGGEHLFKQAKENRKRISKQNKDINYIISKLDNGGIGLSSESILHLFDIIGYKSRSFQNGEFYVLYNEWYQLYPVFMWIKRADTLEIAKQPFTEKGLQRLNIEAVWNAFHI
jgi:hypothetical protein